MNTEKGRVRYKFEVDRVTIWRTRRHTPKTAHTICVCNRLLFYSKCIGFTICLIYSDKLMYITQCEINVELPNLWYTVVLLPQKRFFEWFWVSAVHRPVPSFIGRTVNGKQMVNAIQYTIKYQSVTHTHCVVSLWTHPPRIPRTTLRGVNVSMIMNNYIHTWFIQGHPRRI